MFGKRGSNGAVCITSAGFTAAGIVSEIKKKIIVLTGKKKWMLVRVYVIIIIRVNLHAIAG